MQLRSLSALGVVAVWLLTDFWRLWTPSLITIFGRAAETPPELMGLYALAVMSAPLVLLAFVPRSAPRLAAWLLVAAVAVRILLQANPEGGPVQLYGSSLGVVLAVAALCLATASLGRALVPSVMLGVAVAATTHAALGTFGAVWRMDAWAVALLIVQALLVALAVREVGWLRAEPVAPRTALLVLPGMLLLQLALVNVGRGSAIDPLWGSLAVVAGAWAGVVVALSASPRRRPWVSAVLLVGAVAVSMLPEVTRDGAHGVLSGFALVGFLIGPAALARLLLFAAPGRSSRRTALAAGVGAVVWTAVFFVFYAGYDLGYRADIAIVLLAIGVAAWTIAYRSGGPVTDADVVASVVRIDESGARDAGASVIAGLAAVAVALVGPALTIPTRGVAQSDSLTAAAYNLRMGYGIDGAFDPSGVAAQLRASGARVILLSEIDRGWLLNGGQDQLAILARMLGMRAVFGPAADQVWGDAILTDLPVSDVRTERFPMFDAVTGAGMTTATVRWNGEPVRVISTHLQPDSDGEDRTLRQAELFAARMAEAAAQGPLIAGGDLNTEPGTRAWDVMLGAGVEDALASIRPALTSSADDPDSEIDHLFVAGLDVTAASVVVSELSDHFMITATVE
ncbi:endonuclease/exonuclease/phosphatase family protein [Microbacterium sp.]|uniref:endonuclease/exonuclease/phosphatase family protein n=1 Tax=Microbacterium sp. TaxID=51671 RepID=UPI003F6F203D